MRSKRQCLPSEVAESHIKQEPDGYLPVRLFWYPLGDSNASTRLRRPVLYPSELRGHGHRLYHVLVYVASEQRCDLVSVLGRPACAEHAAIEGPHGADEAQDHRQQAARLKSSVEEWHQNAWDPPHCVFERLIGRELGRDKASEEPRQKGAQRDQ